MSLTGVSGVWGFLYASLVFLHTSWATDVTKNVDVVIVGGGLSGLTTAYELKKLGLSYIILESKPRVGGRVSTVSYNIDGDKIQADSGMEEYWESNPAVRIIHELNLPVSSSQAVSSIMLDGNLESYLGRESKDEYLKRVLTDIGWMSLKKVEAKISPLTTMIEAGLPIPQQYLPLKNMTFKQWVSSQRLPERVTNWIRISVEVEIGTEWDKISALDGIAEYHIFMGRGDRAYKLIGGNERFTDALAEAVGPDSIRLNSRVNRVETKNSQVVVHYSNTSSGNHETIVADKAVMAAPIYTLKDVQFEPALSKEKTEAIDALNWGTYMKVHVFVDAAAANFWQKDGSTVLPILSDNSLGVIYEGSSGRSQTRIVTLLITGETARRFHTMSLDDVRAKILGDFEKFWPGFDKHVKGMEFYKDYPKSIAAWPVGRSRFDEKSQAVRTPENNLYFAGDFTESSHSDGAVRSALRVVQQIKTPVTGVGGGICGKALGVGGKK